MKYCDVPVCFSCSAIARLPYRLSVRLRDVRRLRRRDVRCDRLGLRDRWFDVRRVFDRFLAILPLQYLNEKTARTVVLRALGCNSRAREGTLLRPE